MLGDNTSAPGEVLGTSTEDIPGVPNTGAGGTALYTLLTLAFLLSTIIGGALLLRLRRI